VSDVIPTLRGREECERCGHQRGDVIEGTRSRGAQKRFQFGERLFDGIEVWAVRRQEAEVRAGAFDRAADFRLAVDGEIVKHDDVARLQRRHQYLLDIGEEAHVVDRAIEDGRRGQPLIRRPATPVCVCQWAHGV
jgi:hypothetical protein